MAEWMSLADKKGRLPLKGESCRSIANACCQAVVCATSRTKLRVPLGEVTGRMWSSLTKRCINGGKGGVWYDGGVDMVKLYIQMLRPRSGQCPA